MRLFPIVLCLLSLAACSAQPTVYSGTAADVTDGTQAPTASGASLAATTEAAPRLDPTSGASPSETTEVPTRLDPTSGTSPSEPTESATRLDPTSDASSPTESAPSPSGTTAPFGDTSLPTPSDTPTASSAASEPTLSDAPTSPPQTEHIHFFGEWLIVEADCLNDGYKACFCSCGEQQYLVLPALGHDYVDGVCSRCADRLVPDEPDDTPAVDTAYALVTEQVLLGETLYFNGGANSGIYLATSADPAESVTVYLEQTQGGFYLYFFRGEEKLYIDILASASAAGKAWLKRVQEPSCVYVWDERHHTLVTTLGDHSFFIGSYDLYRTLSAIDVDLISGENASAIGVNIFPAFFLPTQD